MNQSRPKVHFIGIGGIGMSSLARWFLSQKWVVSGSDLRDGELLRGLKKSGINVKIGHRKGSVSSAGVQLVIYSQAVQPDNPELREARRLGTPALTYPEMIGRITRDYLTVAVAGAHGKSTTTALIALILRKAGFDPTVIIGTKLKEFSPPAGGGNFRAGRGPYLVLEADEYGGAFLHYSPTLTVVTTIDKEHLDTYKTLGNVKKNFLKFISQTKRKGTLVVNRDDRNLFSLKSAIGRIGKTKKLRVFWYSLRGSDAKRIKSAMRVPGRHNVSNALAAFTLARAIGIPSPVALRAIGGYRGSWRRLEYRGTYRGARVFDDYAHHPTEIKATLQALREKYPTRIILCIFQPHQAERLKLLFKEFQTAFDGADETLMMPIYRVAGRDRPHKDYDAQALVKTIQKQQPKKPIFYLAKPEHLKNAIAALDGRTSRKVIVMMGAGDIVSYTKTLVS